jgi:hypothetical protein
MDTRWEYKIIDIWEADLHSGDKPAQTLSEAGAEGWEVISVVPWQRDNGTSNLIYTLRRELAK